MSTADTRAASPDSGKHASIESRLAEAEARLRDFLEVVGGWVWETDEQLRFTLVSGLLANSSSVEQQMVLGKTRAELMRDPTSPDARRHLADLASRRPYRDFIYQAHGPSGWRTLKSSGQPYYDAHGRFRGYRGTVSDITAEIEANRRAERIHRRFVDAIEAIPASLLLTDAEDRIVICNSATASFFPHSAHILKPGTSFEEVLRAHAEGGLVEAAVGRVEDWVRERLEQHRNPGAVITRPWTDGRYVEIVEQRTSDGGIIGIRTDVTEHVRRERELDEARNQLREAIDAIADGFALYDAEDRLVLFNRKYAEIYAGTADKRVLGVTFEELVREGIARGLYKDAIGRAEEYLAERLAAHRNPTGIIEQRLDDGLWIRVAERRTRDGGIVGIRTDITELKEKEQALAAQAEELRRSNADLEQFAYIASHDLQEPLRMVGSYCQLLQRRYKGKLDADADEFIGYAVEGAARMQRMISDLLAYSRVGRKEKPLEPVSCADMALAALQNLHIAVQECGAKVTMGALPTVMGDPTQLTQLFQNLVGNALKFRGEAPPEVRISAERAGDVWRIVVEDNGIGIEPQYSERIFLVFQRLNERAKYPGTGIGLAICRKVVERHGGRIWVESDPSKGSRFIFDIPAIPPHAGAGHE
jgi:PAS domain S-box-containing protein